MEIGPNGPRVMLSVSAYRHRLGWSLSELSNRLTKLGHPLHRTVLHKIETGARRIDVDDLVALALALDVTPGELLFGPPVPPDKDPDDVGAGGHLPLTPTTTSADHPEWSARAIPATGGPGLDQMDLAKVQLASQLLRTITERPNVEH